MHLRSLRSWKLRLAAPAVLALLAVLPVPASAGAQEDVGPPTPLEVGTVAPDFELVGATRFGILRDAIRLSDFRGKTVVLAFFFRARSPG